MVLRGNVVKALWSAVSCCQKSTRMTSLNESYYFSTHGCNLVVSSFGVGSLEEEAPLAAAAAARALLLKKFDIRMSTDDLANILRVVRMS